MTIAIDLAEEVLSLTDAAKLLPRRRRGKKPHSSTLYRWATVGLRGVTLETLRVGGTLCTSREALQRFFVALGAQHGKSVPLPTVTSVKSHRRVEMELDRAGL